MIILVADDERLVRFTVKSMLSEILTGEYMILEAANGKDMIEICRQKQPDVAFVDINMPFGNGLDAIEICKEYSKKTEYVILTGYSEFEYAKRGISLGISEYLLKPVEAEELAKVISEIKQKVEKNNKGSNAAFQLKLLDLFNYFSTVGLEEGYEKFELKGGIRYLAYGVFVRSGENKETTIELQQSLEKEIKKLGDMVVSRKGYYGEIYSEEGIPWFVFAYSDEDYIISRMKKLTMLTAGCVGSRVFRFFGTDMKTIYEKMEEIDHNPLVGLNYPAGQVLEYENVSISKEDRRLLHYIQKLLDAWNKADGVVYKEELNQIYRGYKDKTIGINLKYVAEYCSEMTGKQIVGSSFKEFCKSFVDISEGMYVHVKSEENDMIEQVKDYIQKYYMKDISMSQLAERYQLTANYLSTVFHLRTGGKFIDYLTEIRMTNAKKLLIQNATASIQDIALMVGYNSARHFSTLFQKQTGMTPTAYRKSKV